MAIEFVSAVHDGDFALVSSLTVSINPTAGNLLLGIASHQDLSERTWPAGWTKVADLEEEASYAWKIATGSETECEVVFSTPTVQAHLVVMEFSGAAYLTHASPQALEFNGATHAIPSVTPGTTDDILLVACAWAKQAYSMIGHPAGYTFRSENAVDSGNDSSRFNTWTKPVISPTGSYSSTCTYAGEQSGFVGGHIVLGPSVPSEEEPPPEDPPGVVVHPPGDGPAIAILTTAREMRVRVEENNVGSFSFIINRYSAEATEANLAKGNLVRWIRPEIDATIPIFEGILETGDFDLVSQDEEGGEDLHFAGRGSLAYLERAILAAETYLPIDDDRRNTGIYPAERLWRFADADIEGPLGIGQILYRVLDEATAALRPQDPLAGLTLTFSRLEDTDNVDWTAFEGTYETPIGRSCLDVGLELVRLGQLIWRMDAGLILSAWQDYERDLTGAAFATGVVRFVKGVNIAEDLTRQMHGAEYGTHALVGAKQGYIWTDSGGTPPYVYERFVDVSNVDDTTLAGDSPAIVAGETSLGYREDSQQQVYLVVNLPLPQNTVNEAIGLYLPGPPGTTNGKYWIGDTVRVHTGTGETDFNERDFRIHALTIFEDQTGALAPVGVELSSPYVPNVAPNVSPLAAGTVTGGGTGGGGGTPTAHNHVAGAVSVLDVDANFAGTNVETILAEIAAGSANAYDLGWFNVKDYGATGDGVTDDRDAIQDAIDACAAAGGGTVWFPAGHYIIGGALQDTGAFNGQILFPDLDDTDDHIVIHLRGALRPGLHPVYGTAYPLAAGYTVLESTLTGATGNAAVFSGGNNLAAPHLGGGNNLEVIVEQLVCVGPNNPTFTFWNLTATQAGGVRAVQGTTAGGLAGTSVEPTNTNAYFLKLPQKYFSGYTFVEDVSAAEWYTCILDGELTIYKGVGGGNCIVFMECPETFYPSLIVDITLTAFQYGIRFTGEHRLDILSYTAEHATDPPLAAWQVTVADIDDPSDLGHGYHRWFCAETGGAPDHTFTVIGGANLGNQEVGSAWGTGGSALTIEDEGTPLATAATTLDFVGAGVTASGTGAEKTITIPGGVTDLDDLSDVTIASQTGGEEIRWDPATSQWINDSGMICVDPGSIVVDDGTPFGITLTSVWGIDGTTPYYDDANAAAGDEAALFYDPLTDNYTLVAYDF